MARPVGLALSALVDVHAAAIVSRDDLLPILPADMCLRTTLAGNRYVAHLACPSVEVLQPVAAGHRSSVGPRRSSRTEHAKTGANSTYGPAGEDAAASFRRHHQEHKHAQPSRTLTNRVTLYFPPSPGNSMRSATKQPAASIPKAPETGSSSGRRGTPQILAAHFV